MIPIGKTGFKEVFVATRYPYLRASVYSASGDLKTATEIALHINPRLDGIRHFVEGVCLQNCPAADRLHLTGEGAIALFGEKLVLVCKPKLTERRLCVEYTKSTSGQ